MKNIKLIATDLDGTILHNGKFANLDDRLELQRLQEQGYFLTIVTGQSYLVAAKIAKALGIDKFINKMVCQNGAYITTVDKFQPEGIELMDKKIVEQLINYFNEKKIIFQMLKYDEFNNIYFNDIESTISIKSQQKKNFIDVNKMKGFEGMSQIWTSVPPIGYENFFDDLKDKYHNELSIVSSYNDDHTKLVYLISNKKANKGDKLLELATQFNICPEEILSFGDGGNDVLMFEKINHSVAMGNAQDYVKKSAKYITQDALNAGVANFLKLHFA